MKLKIKVVPGASREGMEWLGENRETLKIRVSAPPEKGKANKAVEKYLAGRLGLPAAAVSIISGATSPRKTVEISGLTEQEILARLSPS